MLQSLSYILWTRYKIIKLLNDQRLMASNKITSKYYRQTDHEDLTDPPDPPDPTQSQ